MNYPKHWRLAFLLALFLHFFIWSGMTFLVPLLGSKPTIAAEDAMSLEDVPGEDTGDEGEEGNSEEETPEETPPAPQPPQEPEPAPVEDTAAEEEDLDDTSPIIADNDEDAIAQFKKELAEEKTTGKKASGIIVHKGNGQHLNTAPKLVMDYYPPEGLTNFKGRVTVSATIGKDGRVIRTKIMVTSGRTLVDQHAIVAVKKWLFKPALDDKGQPMEVDKIISIPFNVPNIPRQIEEHNRIGKD